MNLNKKIAGLFKDYDSNPKIERLNILTAFILGLLLLGIFNNLPSQQPTATVFFIMIIAWGVWTGIEQTTTRKALKQNIVYGIGKNPLIGLAAGILLGLLITRFNITPSFSSITSSKTLTLFFVGVVAPYVEANFFRGLTMGVLYDIGGLVGVKNNVLKGLFALNGQAILFAWFHVILVEGSQKAVLIPSDLSVLTPFFLFGVISGLGVLLFKTIMFEYGFHTVNNLRYLL